MPAETTFISLEFGTPDQEAVPLGDLAASLVTVDELLRDLASIAAYPSSPEFRNIEVVAIAMRKPLKITLSLLAISADAVTVFQELCRHLIASRERSRSMTAERMASITATLQGLGDQARLTEKEMQRICDHVRTLQNAEVPLKRVEVTAATF